MIGHFTANANPFAATFAFAHDTTLFRYFRIPENGFRTVQVRAMHPEPILYLSIGLKEPSRFVVNERLDIVKGEFPATYR